MSKTILITGGCGFIGTSLIKQLLKRDSNSVIRIVDNFVTGTQEDLSEVCDFTVYDSNDIHHHTSGVGLIEGDIRDAELMVKVAQGVDGIVHLAANTGVGPSVEDPRLDMECNVVGTFNMLEAARINGVKNFVFASSGAPAGEVEPPIHEELPPHPVSPYGSSKLAGEGYCSSYAKTFGIGTVALRFGNVYGPRSKNKASVVAKFIKQALNGETCMIYGDGKQTRDFIYIDDLIKAVILGIDSDVGGETFQIATGRESTVGEVAQMIADELKKRGVTMSIDNEAPRLGDVARNFSDTTKAKEVLGWVPDTTLKDGIAKTVDYFIEMEQK